MSALPEIGILSTRGLIMKLIRWANVNPNNKQAMSVVYKTEFQARKAMERQQKHADERGTKVDWTIYIQVKLEGTI